MFTSPAEHAAAALSVAQMWDQLTDVTSGSAYVNYLDAHMPNWAQAYYGDNLARLRQVVRCYDPGRLFTFAHAITPG
jgi:hypothetical protein